MLRSSPASAMQKTYDDCYLICSTAVYFEKQNNEDEALRSWRSALDNIYYFNAYKMSPAYQPKNETEQALQESLISMERQCKERVDLLEGLRKSRLEGDEDAESAPEPRPNPSTALAAAPAATVVPGANGHLATSHRPALPARPAPSASSSSGANSGRAYSLPHIPKEASRLNQLATDKRSSRTPSPEKRGGMLKTTLRAQQKETASNSSTTKLQRTMRSRPPAAAKAATLAWPNGSIASDHTVASLVPSGRPKFTHAPNISPHRTVERDPNQTPGGQQSRGVVGRYTPPRKGPAPPPKPISARASPRQQEHVARIDATATAEASIKSQTTTQPSNSITKKEVTPQLESRLSLTQSLEPLRDFPSYRKEYKPSGTAIDAKRAQAMAQELHGNGSKVAQIAPPSRGSATPGSSSESETQAKKLPDQSRQQSGGEKISDPIPSTPSTTSRSNPDQSAWDARVQELMQNLPRGVDEQAAKAIFNEIVIKGDEVHWDDVAGLEIAKGALKEAVVYPFLRPDLFMGLREPARGMLLFGPPGTGKTMLARAVATESRSTFFAISASSLTSKYLGESEKLVRALFSIAKALTPSIIFVDEIDSLLSARAGSGEHEATRRIKTEFLIQWSDLAKAAAGRDDKTEGDASRVLVLAATNLPWAIDEAARRRFVRRQYIPLPEQHVREQQLRRLMSAQKHVLSDDEFLYLVQLTDGFSGSDITALAKDAAMGPLRALGEKLLHMSPEDIKPISLEDFEQSLVNIRPSVSKQGLKEFEDWAREFGERGG